MVSATFATQPLLAIPLVLGLLIAIGALFLQIEPRSPSASRKGANHKAKCSYVPMFVHLALVLIAGIYLPAAARRLVPDRGEAARIGERWPHSPTSPGRAAKWKRTALGRAPS